VYGVAAAAQDLFQQPLDKLSITEAAFLAALAQGAEQSHPFKYPDAARSRRDYVLDAVGRGQGGHAGSGRRGEADRLCHRNSAASADPGATGSPRRWSPASHRFGPDTTTRRPDGANHLDPALQIAAEKTLRDGLMAMTQSVEAGAARWRIWLCAADFETKWPAALNEQARPRVCCRPGASPSLLGYPIPRRKSTG